MTACGRRSHDGTPLNLCSRKGEIRAQIATTLLNKIAKGSVTALIARSADFYGPHVRTSVVNRLVHGVRGSRKIHGCVIEGEFSCRHELPQSRFLR